MPYVNVYVEAEDILDDLSDRELEEELASRRQKAGKPRGHAADFSIPQKAARYTLGRGGGHLPPDGPQRPGFQA